MSASHESPPDAESPVAGPLLVEALQLAAQGPDTERWRRITVLTPGMSPAEVDIVDRALRDWPDSSRIAPRNWGVPLPPLTTEPYCPPALRIARSLEIVRLALTADDVHALVTCGHLGNLRSSSFIDNAFDLQCIETLASSQGFDNLDVLSISENRVGDEGLTALSQSRLLGQLCFLDISGNGIGPAGLAALAGSEHLSKLAVLLLSLNHCGDDGMAALASARAAFSELDLSENEISPHGARALISAPALARLCKLSLAYNDLGVEGARALASAAQLQTLSTLNLAGTMIGAEGALAILASPHLQRLRTLDLRDIGLDDRGAQQLLASEGLKRLEILRLGLNPISESLLQAMVEQAKGHRTHIIAADSGT